MKELLFTDKFMLILLICLIVFGLAFICFEILYIIETTRYYKGKGGDKDGLHY